MKTLYKRTSTGKVQIWRQEIDGSKYRTISGQKDGKKVTSEWTQCVGKNIGKANETTPEDQCKAEVESNYTKKLAQGKYHETEHEIDNAKFFAPMLAKDWHDYEHLFVAEEPGMQMFTGCYSQPKLDGVRCILKADGLWSRNGKPLISAPHITRAFKDWFEKYPNDVFDGELYSDRLNDNFQKIVSLARQQNPTEDDLKQSSEFLKLHVYDYPSVDGCFSKRFNKLADVVLNRFSIDMRTTVQLVETNVINDRDHLDELYAAYMSHGYEGQMIRRDSGRYANKRDKQLLKRKEFIDKEFPVDDILEGIGNWSGYAKSVVIRLENGDKQNAGIAGTRKFTQELLVNKKKYIGGDTTVRYQRLSNDGFLIFPVAIAFYGAKRDV